MFDSNRRRNSQGFGLIEVLVAVGIVSMMGLAMMTLVSNQATLLRFLEQKGESLEFKSLIALSFQDADLCTCQINPDSTYDNFNDGNLWFDSTVADGTQSMSIKRIKSGCALTAPKLLEEGQRLASGITVDKIDLINLLPTTNPNEWQGDWQVTWLQNSNDRPIKPILVKTQKFLIDPTSPANHRKVFVCQGMGTQLRVESGTGEIPTGCSIGTPVSHSTNTAIPVGGWFCQNGAPYKDITFSVPFTTPPRVIVTLSGPSANATLVPCSGGAMDQVGTDVLNITTTGFRGRSWFSPISLGLCGPIVENGTAPNQFDWIAIGR